MPAVSRVGVIGGGSAGCAAAILLAEAGVAVDLIEIKPAIDAVGSGITLQGNALRVLRQLGVWDDVRAAGYPFDSLGLRAADAAATLLDEVPDARTGGPDLPATLGMPRPDLARILLTRAAAAGATLRLGTTFTALSPDAGGVDVLLDDGSTARYDLLVGADGIRSRTRQAIGIDAAIRPLGMGIWRMFGPRPASVVRTDLYYGGPAFIAGYCPTAEASLYAYLVEPFADHTGAGPADRLEIVRRLAAAYHGPWDEIRETLTDPAQLNYTGFETHMLDAPWNRGRVVVIGDAAHSCPPTLAQGGAQALEDAAVLAELLITSTAVDDTFWDAFHARRVTRAGTVVAASNQLCEWLLAHERRDVPGLMRSIAELVGVPA